MKVELIRGPPSLISDDFIAFIEFCLSVIYTLNNLESSLSIVGGDDFLLIVIIFGIMF